MLEFAGLTRSDFELEFDGPVRLFEAHFADLSCIGLVQSLRLAKLRAVVPLVFTSIYVLLLEHLGLDFGDSDLLVSVPVTLPRLSSIGVDLRCHRPHKSLVLDPERLLVDDAVVAQTVSPVAKGRSGKAYLLLIESL